jgi:hypothetical protein
LIKEVNENEAETFINKFAINKFIGNKYIGTYANNKLISLVSFSFINNNWYLIDMCSNSKFQNNYEEILNYFKQNISEHLLFKHNNCWPLDTNLLNHFIKINDIDPGAWILNKNHQKVQYFENDEQIKDLTINKLYDCGHKLLEMK